ncbi:MAG: YraN family protein [Proteobacteria bacterium]|nr:YraN family protein [Pseudomonadota bacterium]
MASTEARATTPRPRRGERWERHAETQLVAQGLTCVARNHSCRGGEIDLVMLADDSLVFVEVRYRRGASHGSAVESIDARKQRRLIRAAEDFLMRHPQFANHACRFDVMAMYGDASHPQCDWIAGAFSA